MERIEKIKSYYESVAKVVAAPEVDVSELIANVKFFKYDPNQLRDDDGRWADGGGGGGGGGGDGASGATIENEIKQGGSSQTLYSKDGVYTKARLELHDKIISEYLKNGEPSDDPTATIIAGVTANGKSSLLAAGNFDTLNSVVINPDDVKVRLPEYDRLLKTDKLYASTFVHEESSDIANKIIQRASDKKINITIDKIFDEGAEKAVSRLDMISAKGYKLNINYVSLDLNQAIRNSEARFLKTGRHVPISYIRMSDKNIPETFEGVSKKYNAKLYDTNIQGRPRLVAHSVNGKMNIVSPELWLNFLNKKNG